MSHLAAIVSFGKHRMKRLTKVLGVCLLGALLVSCAARPASEKPKTLAEEFDALCGKSWYGVYFAGEQKCGFAEMVLLRKPWRGQESYSVNMWVDITVTMGGAGQKLVVAEKRHYTLTGELLGIESMTDSVLGKTYTVAEVKGGTLTVKSTTAGWSNEQSVPAPDETLESVLAGRRLVRTGKPGDEVSFEVFDPMLSKTMHVTSKLLRFEDRLIGGVTTRVGVLQSTFHEAGMKSTDYATEDGDLLETVVGGLLTLRKEPENLAKDVRFAFDAMRAGIIPVKTPLGNRARLTGLKLRLSGIPKPDLLIDDDRQTYERGEDGPAGTHLVTLRAASAPARPLTLPIDPGPEDGELARCLRPSAFIQSDAPEVIKVAKEIVGNETNSFKAASKIQAWVYRRLRKKGLAAVSNALAVLRQGEGDCSEHSILFVALCRAAGIPAREAVGIGYSAEMQGFGYHAWGEVYVGRWVAMDPTWGENLADPTHVKFGAGDMDSVIPIAGLFGSLKIDVVEVEQGGR